MKLNYKEINPDRIPVNKFKVFLAEDDPIALNIIKTGFEDQYFVIHENGWEDQDHGKIETLTKQQIKDKYGIEV